VDVGTAYHAEMVRSDGPPANHRYRRFELVITCVDYADYLAETLPENLDSLQPDNVVVVTSNEDAETLELCRKLSVPCYATGKFHEHGVPFNKALAINHGLKYLRYHDWVMHLDADTALSPRSGWWLRRKTLDKGKIYGFDRFDCRGYPRWKRYQLENHSGWDYHCRVYPPPDMGMLPRIALMDDGGWAPIGYGQLWNLAASGRRYPVHEDTYATAERTDVAHSTQWDETDRILLGEVFSLHLRPEKEVALGTNWNGRDYKLSPRFGPGV